jgi:hypothetical protein
VVQTAPLAPDQAGKGRREQKAAANCHDTPARSGIVDACHSYIAEEGRGNPEPRIIVSAGRAANESKVLTKENALTELAVRGSLSGRIVRCRLQHHVKIIRQVSRRFNIRPCTSRVAPARG